MKLSLILESVQDQIQTLAAKHRQDPSAIVDTCKTVGEKYWKWVLKHLSGLDEFGMDELDRLIAATSAYESGAFGLQEKYFGGSTEILL